MIPKTQEIYNGFYTAHPTLRAIGHWIENYYRTLHEIEPVMTSSLRTMATHIRLYSSQKNKKTGKLYTVEEIRAKLTVHMVYPLRGFDLRSRLLTASQNAALVAAINKEWIYDPDRPHIKCAQLHKVGDNAFHLHIQVHPDTIRRTK